uniref:Uncharacterized protein n=1 Tax=Tetradesmus obliquus TaxID=3088 RepID=A0A383W6K5_TETOB|eukprot:jgi/Sobl393_1/8811/SZX73285.1
MCATARNGVMNARSRTQLPDERALTGLPDTTAAAEEQQLDIPVRYVASDAIHHAHSWRAQQKYPVASFVPSAELLQLELQPQLLQGLVEQAVVTTIARLACSMDQHGSPMAAAAAAAGTLWQADQQQQLDAAATAVDQKSAFVRQFLAVDAQAALVGSSACTSIASHWANSSTPLAATEAGLLTWQQQLPSSPVLPPHGGLSALGGADAVSAAAFFRGNCAKGPATAPGPAPPPPAASRGRPAPVRRRTFSGMQHAMPARSAAAATAPATPYMAGSGLHAPWTPSTGSACISCPPHLLSSSLARASSTGDIAAFPAGAIKAVRRNSSGNSCCSRLSDCSSGFASSRSSSDGGSSSSSSPEALPTPSAITACTSCGQLQPPAAAAAAASPARRLLLQPLQLQPPSVGARQPSPPQALRGAGNTTPGKTSPRSKFVSPATPPSPGAGSFAGAPACAPAGCSSGSRFVVAPPRALLQRGACGGAELRASVGRYRRFSTSMSGLAGEASSLSDGALGAAGSVLDSARFGGGECARFRWAGCSLDGRVLGCGGMPSSPSGAACGGGGAAAYAAAMAAVSTGSAGMAGQ